MLYRNSLWIKLPKSVVIQQCVHIMCTYTSDILLSGYTVSRPWQIIPKDSPIILFFYSQIFSLLFPQTSLLFSQTSSLLLHYSQTCIQKLHKTYSDDIHIHCADSAKINCHDLCTSLCFKFNPKTTAFGKVNCNVVCKILCVL